MSGAGGPGAPPPSAPEPPAPEIQPEPTPPGPGPEPELEPSRHDDTPPTPPEITPAAPQGEDAEFQALLQHEGDMVPRTVFLERLNQLQGKRTATAKELQALRDQYNGVTPEKLQDWKALDEWDQNMGVVLQQEAWLREVLQARMQGRPVDYTKVQAMVAEQMKAAGLKPPVNDPNAEPEDPAETRLKQLENRQQATERHMLWRQQQAEIQDQKNKIREEISGFETANPSMRGNKQFIGKALAIAHANRTDFTTAAKELLAWRKAEVDAEMANLTRNQPRRERANPGGPAAPAAAPVTQRPKVGSKEEAEQMDAWARGQAGS